ncbi:MAG TPA: hypothetical protein VHB79_36380 [Polyangiaceae bacterium]|nr:hypothetical protein [Polyangiaceae bacterium]
MSDPPRLLDQPGTSASTLELLRELQPPEAPPASVQAALVRDLSGLVAGSSLKAAGLALWVKATLVGALALGAGGAAYVARSAAPGSASVPPPASRPNAAASAAVVALVSPTAAETPAAAPAPAAASLAVPEKAKRVASPAPRDALAEEEALLEAARRAVASDPAYALSLLRKHQSQFPNGQLSAERLYLGVDALQRLGNTGAARRDAAALTKYYPNSAYARRVPALLAAAPSK